MRYYVLLFFTLFFTINAFGQKDTLAGKSYYELTDIIRKAKDTAISLGVTRYYLAKAIEEKRIVEQWHGVRTLAQIHFNEQNFVKSEAYLEQLISLAKREDLKAYKYQTQLVGGLLTMREGTFRRALDFFNEARLLAEAENNIENIQTAYHFLNLIQAMGGDYTSAIDTQHKLLAKLKTIDTVTLPAEKRAQLFFMTQVSIGDSYLKAKNADSAYFYSKKALNLSLKKEDSCVIKTLYWQLGLAEVYKKKYKKALQSIEDGKRYCAPLTRIDSLIVGGVTGKIYLGTKEYKKAISAFEVGINAYNVSESEEGFMDDLYFNLATAYKEDGNIEKAGYYLEKHVNSQNKFSLIKNTINSSFREKEIAEFKEELRLLKSENESTTSYLVYVLLGGTIIILVLLFYLLKFYKNKKVDEAKFNALLVKINAANTPSDIIDTKDEELEGKASGDVSIEVTQQILEGLKKLELKEYFLQQDCNSYNVAKKIGTNTTYLSKVINSHFGKNFNTYINDLRINYAIVRIKNDVLFRSYSIQSIAEEIGYKSADSFAKYFKKDTGLNPSFYIKNIKNIT